MRPGSQKSKGNNFENELAKQLSFWLTKQVRGDVLERSPASGGKSTSLRKRNVVAGHIAGDLIAVADEGFLLINRFVVEAKHQNETGINATALIFMTAQNGVIAYWKKLLDECQQTEKLPMLIFRQNNRPSMIGLCKEGVALFNFKNHPHAVFKLGKKSMFLATLDSFLTNANPDVLLNN